MSDLIKLQYNYLLNGEEILYNVPENPLENINDDTIISIEDLGYIDDYVYDLETEDGTFSAGIGSIIVHNTDSVFITRKNKEKKLNLKDRDEINGILTKCFDIGKDMAEQASSLFEYPILLEFEKVYLPYIIFKKKYYIGTMYETPDYDKGKIDKKGIVLKRRDNPNITKKIYQGIIDILFGEGELGVSNCIEFLKEEIRKILDKRVDMEDLVITKTYKKDYKSQNIPHKILAEKMKERDPGSAPNVNDRVPYVFVEGSSSKQYEKVEHPEYVIEHNLKIDSIYYVDRIKNPITQLLITFIPKSVIDEIFRKCIQEYVFEKSGQKKITSFFKKKEN